MGHTIADKSALLSRVRKISGQVNSVSRALQDEAGCTIVLQRIAAVRGAVASLMVEVVEEHLRTHVVAGSLAKRSEAANEVMSAVRTYLK